MGDIERVQRIIPPVPVDSGRVHKTDEARDQRQQPRHHQENDSIELSIESETEETSQPPSSAAPDDEGHLDIAV